jgi:phage terminase small subunit
VLESVCVHTVLARKLAACIERKGFLQCDRVHGGLERTAPWVKALRSETALLLQLHAALGITPMARSAIYIPPVTGPKSELEVLLDEPATGDFPPPNS